MTHYAVLVVLEDLQPGASVKAIDTAVQTQLEPFYEGGEWFADGTRWDWWTVGGRWHDAYYCGPVFRIGDLDLEKQQQHARRQATRTWEHALLDSGNTDTWRELVYGIKADHTYEQYLEAQTPKQVPMAMTFVRRRHWHENGRVGWFGGETLTECEQQGKEPRVCRYRHADSEAIISSYNMSDEDWAAQFRERFIVSLPPNTLCAVVDCHV
jgi:hypothetical protein